MFDVCIRILTVEIITADMRYFLVSHSNRIPLKLNKTKVLNPKMGLVRVTTYVSHCGSPGISE